MLDRMPDRTFVFAVISLLLSIAAFAYLVLWPSFEVVERGADGVATIRFVGIAEANGLIGLGIALMPVLLTLGSILSVPPNGGIGASAQVELDCGYGFAVGLHIGFFGSDRCLLRAGVDDADFCCGFDVGA